MTEKLSNPTAHEYNPHTLFQEFVADLNSKDSYCTKLSDALGDESYKVMAVIKKMGMKPANHSNVAWGLLTIAEQEAGEETYVVPALSLDENGNGKEHHQSAANRACKLLPRKFNNPSEHTTNIRLFALLADNIDDSTAPPVPILMLEADSAGRADSLIDPSTIRVLRDVAQTQLPDTPIMYTTLVDGTNWNVIKNNSIEQISWIPD